MPDEPVRGISKNVLLNRRNFLSRIDNTNVILGTLFCRLYPNVFQVVFLGMWQDVMCLFNVNEGLRWLLRLPEQILVPIENPLNHTICRSLVDLRIAARLVDNDQTPVT